MDLESPISILPGVGPWIRQKLDKLEICSIEDLLYYFPFRYQNYSLTSKIQTLQSGEVATIQGQIVQIQNVYLKSGRRLQKAVVSDGADEIEITWFNQPYLIKTLPAGTFVSLSGKVKLFGRKRILVAPDYEKLAPQGTTSQAQHSTIHTGRLVPIYPETEGLSSKWLRTKIAIALPQTKEQITDYLSYKILSPYDLLPLSQAISWIHFPNNLEQAQTARRRLAFDEFFKIQLKALYRKKSWQEKKTAHKLPIHLNELDNFIKSFTFELTNAQYRAIKEVVEDIKKKQPMNRLLEGDVGSGKTVIAACACFIAYKNGFQSVIMAPTQILAQQHFNTLDKLLAPLGIVVGLKIQNSALQKDQKYDVIIGTQALIQKSVDFANLALVVIDEQHRFGVVQRALLAQKAQAKTPHVLTMTATPIPRTVALTIYGDLDLSVLDEMPKGRLRIKTWVVPSIKREAAYEWIRKRVKATKEQAFIICPLIEQSEKETMQSVKAASVEFKHLEKEVFPDLRLGLLHGRLKTKEKNEIMGKFKKGQLDILVATPVVEVGIDVPTATIMLIEASERFGLAQLHQLRGRVGRGDKQSYCLLFTTSRQPHTIRRLKALETMHSGSVLAELDLKLRGPGEAFGTAQHGFPQLRVGTFADTEIIKAAREVAGLMINKIQDNPILETIVSKDLLISPN